MGIILSVIGILKSCQVFAKVYSNGVSYKAATICYSKASILQFYTNSITEKPSAADYELGRRIEYIRPMAFVITNDSLSDSEVSSLFASETSDEGSELVLYLPSSPQGQRPITSSNANNNNLAIRQRPQIETDDSDEGSELELYLPSPQRQRPRSVTPSEELSDISSLFSPERISSTIRQRPQIESDDSEDESDLVLHLSSHESDEDQL